ncbi:MAG: helix-turn-helix domain-containing protein [Bacteroidales bacterium]|nr:helix-turn-helix domain-containing protein [Bacteroidales bacterium]
MRVLKERKSSLTISRLLKDKNYSFTDISDMFNFSFPSYFTRYVKKYLGASPSDFRK